VNPGAGEPVHVPGFAVSVEPCTACPEIVGGDVFTGGEAPVPTGPTAAEVADDDPDVFVPVTVTATVNPASADTNVYVCAVWPPIGLQLPPPLLQRNH
jgi:hypothetical protein